MSSEKYLTVSGVMFLVAIKSFEIFNQILPGILKQCNMGPRFAGSLIASTLAVALLVSTGLSFYYFKKFIDEACSSEKE